MSSKIVAALKNPAVIAMSLFGSVYGGYNIISGTVAGKAYNPDVDIKDKTYIITGANSGIGHSLASELASRDARVIMACRNREECITARRAIVLTHRNKKVYCRKLDLEDFDSVREFVAKLQTGKTVIDRIDGIIHNAAVWERNRDVNKNGIEKMMAINHMGAFLMTGLLLDKLLEEQKTHPVKIVFMNTNIIEKSPSIDFEDFNVEHKLRKGIFKEHFDEHFVYKMSKLAQATFAKELSERLKGTNIQIMVVDPGKTKSGLHKKLSMNDFFLSRWIFKLISTVADRSPDKSIRPVLYALVDPETESKNGIWINGIEEKWPNLQVMDDEKQRKKLWATTEIWTHFQEHYNKLRSDLNLSPLADIGDEISEEKKAQNSWYRLW